VIQAFLPVFCDTGIPACVLIRNRQECLYHLQSL